MDSAKQSSSARFGWLADGTWLSHFEATAGESTSRLPQLPTNKSRADARIVAQHSSSHIVRSMWHAEDSVQPKLHALENSSLAHRAAQAVHRQASLLRYSGWQDEQHTKAILSDQGFDSDFPAASEAGNLARIQWM